MVTGCVIRVRTEMVAVEMGVGASCPTIQAARRSWCSCSLSRWSLGAEFVEKLEEMGEAKGSRIPSPLHCCSPNPRIVGIVTISVLIRRIEQHTRRSPTTKMMMTTRAEDNVLMG